MASRFTKSNKFHYVKNSKIIWPKDITKGSIFAHGNQTLNIFEFKSSMWFAFKNKTRGPTNLNRIGCICISFQKIG